MIYRLGERSVVADGEFFVADNATVVGSVRLGHNASVWFGSVVRGDNEQITLGEGCNIQDGSVLHADPGIPLTLARNVTVGHMVMLHGCTVGEGSLIGIRSVLLNRSVIGRRSLVGAGTLIPEGKSYPDGVLILGTPGKVVRELSPDEIAYIGSIASHYVENSRRYRSGLSPQLLPAAAPR
jgi:carbonic anhydrase/acetyltransferase-like protein (isoleucine patch superfamily)